MRWLIMKLLWSLNLYSKARMLWILYDRLHIFRRRNELNFFSQFVKRGDICFDIGACVGQMSKIYLNLGAKKVVCVEPSKQCLQQLYKSFKNKKRVIIVPKGVAEKNGRLKLYTNKDEPAIATMNDKWRREFRFSNNFKWTDSYTVPVTTLDSLIRQYGLPTFCKIDVEGFEKPVIKGLSQPIKFISFEFQKELLDDAYENMKYLSSLGNVKFNCVLCEEWDLKFSNWINADILYKKLRSINNKYLCGDIYAKYKL